jgi:DNA primase
MIPQAFIQDLLARIDIVDIVGRTVKLKKAGANLQGLCPFHNEKSPSFTVSPTKQFYHCFGCGAHGTAVGFLMEHHGLSYVDAIHELASGLGLAVPREAGDRQQQEASRVAPSLLQVLQTSADYYKQRLRETPRAIEYLKSRELTGATAARFGIGYAPAGWRSLESAVADYSDEAMVAAGLVISGEDGKRYDRFRDRIMFPIRNARGQVIGFGGRILDEGEPKYLNSPEGPLFSKGRELYGLFESREAIRSGDLVLVVEGYMDVVMLHQHGVEYAVATLGTATTAAHLAKLLRQAARIVFAFDGDSAGQRAAWRALENSLPMLSDTKRLDFLFLPPAHDPDSFIREQGLEAFESLVAGALPLSAYLVRELCRRVDLATPEGRARIQADLKPLVKAMPDIALRTQIVLEVAGKAGVEAGELLRYLGLKVAPPAPAAAPRQGSWQGGYSRSERGGFDRGAPGGFDRADRSGGDRWAGGSTSRSGPGSGFAARRGQGGFAGSSSQPWSRGQAALRSRAAAPPTLEAQIKLLLAYHPPLARQALAADFLPEHLLHWRDRIAALPAGSNFAVLLEGLKIESPQEAATLAATDLKSPGLMGDLSLEQAQQEYDDALARLKLLNIRAEIDTLARQGLESPGHRTRYNELMAAARRLSVEDNS